MPNLSTSMEKEHLSALAASLVFSARVLEGDKMSRNLEGKVAVVIGASKGIGAGIAKHLAAEGRRL
jgi:5,10-methylene-tetrahydrofolate dehydrogenase/methenyl tetrahydrofolate cyclohydrolase